MKKIINAKEAPTAIGPYSQAIVKNNMIFISGQLPIDAKTNEFPANDITLQTKESLKNLKAVLDESGFEVDDIVKTTIYLSDIENFAAMNEDYNKFFTGDYPARSAFAVKDLPKGALVEIEAIAVK